MKKAHADSQDLDAATCPLCRRPVQTGLLTEAWWAEPRVVQRMAGDHPTWRLPDGACPACLQEALLRVLLSEGDAALHAQIQNVWPLDARAAFDAIPTPLRLHADPRFTGKGVALALLDTGFYPHPDLTQPVNRIRAWADATVDPVAVIRFGPEDRPMWPEWDALHGRQWHGTMTSVAAAGNGWRSHGLYRGLASDVQIVLIQVENDAQRMTDAAIVRALRWAADQAGNLGIRVVSLSIGAGSHLMAASHPINAAVSDLAAQGVTVVAAAGNDGVRRLTPPASAPEALTVGGLDDRNSFSHDEIELWHSNYGMAESGAHKPELVAPSMWVVAPVLPGSEIEREAQQLFSRRHRDPERHSIEARIAALKLVTPHYQHVEGTSFAAPITASVIACMIEANPELNPGMIRQMLLTTAQPVSGVSRERQGAGAVSAGAAVAQALAHRHFQPFRYPKLPHIGSSGVTFLLHDHDAGLVELFGSWNGWSAATVMAQVESGVWQVDLPRLAAGRYVYKYLIDGKRWFDDPANPHKAWDGFSGFNSLFFVS